MNIHKIEQEKENGWYIYMYLLSLPPSLLSLSPSLLSLAPSLPPSLLLFIHLFFLLLPAQQWLSLPSEERRKKEHFISNENQVSKGFLRMVAYNSIPSVVHSDSSSSSSFSSSSLPPLPPPPPPPLPSPFPSPLSPLLPPPLPPPLPPLLPRPTFC